MTNSHDGEVGGLPEVPTEVFDEAWLVALREEVEWYEPPENNDPQIQYFFAESDSRFVEITAELYGCSRLEAARICNLEKLDVLTTRSVLKAAGVECSEQTLTDIVYGSNQTLAQKLAEKLGIDPARAEALWYQSRLELLRATGVLGRPIAKPTET